MGKEYIPIPRGSQSPDSHFIETTCQRSRIQASIQFDLFAVFKRVPAALIYRHCSAAIRRSLRIRTGILGCERKMELFCFGRRKGKS
jgi:hypothetical protein